MNEPWPTFSLKNLDLPLPKRTPTNVPPVEEPSAPTPMTRSDQWLCAIGGRLVALCVLLLFLASLAAMAGALYLAWNWLTSV